MKQEGPCKLWSFRARAMDKAQRKHSYNESFDRYAPYQC